MTLLHYHGYTFHIIALPWEHLSHYYDYAMDNIMDILAVRVMPRVQSDHALFTFARRQIVVGR